MHARIIIGLLGFILAISCCACIRYRNDATKKTTISKIIFWFCFSCILSYGLVLYYIPSTSWYVVNLSFILFVAGMGYFINEHINILTSSLSIHMAASNTSIARRYRRITYIFSLFIMTEAILIFKPKEFPFEIPDGLAMAIAAVFAAYLSAEIAENVIDKQNRVEIAKNRQRSLEMLQSETAQLLSSFVNCIYAGDRKSLDDANYLGYKIEYHLDSQNLLTTSITRYIIICKYAMADIICQHQKKT